ncbi:hypothetical protein HUT18_16145 [Streptomyces sp. NA04227]|uniref:hypothetical protein n=1 Tax=Streptomyces sp. NA04227 TaxID=2742136 RepID=UPI00158FFCC1|nr:hypothetical protein [Streptomyces sp. NA04227]QKW07685.1 hypothetical protein HUT18_16145 [Streptomyces sp. NA04227]
MRTNGGAFRRSVLARKVLPVAVATGIGIAGLTACSGDDGGDKAGKAGKAGSDKVASSDDAKSRNTKADAKPAGDIVKTAAGAEFPTWGTRWVVHATPDINSASVGMINKGAPGQDRIIADHQVNTGRKVCEGNACSTYMAHITGPVSGYLSVVAVDIPQDSLPGVPVQGDGGPPPGQPGGSREEALKRAAGWLTANGGAQVPYSQGKVWKDGYRQDCSGYVSMALGLGAPGTNTVGLTSPAITKPIPVNDLRPGDLLIDADGNSNTRHVVMFEKWDNPAHTSYTAFEQRGGHGTDHRSLTYGLNNNVYKAYRPLKFND